LIADPDAAVTALPTSRILNLGLRTFRNHAAASLRLDGRHVCLFGPNGAGKTNLLEALSMLAPGKGLRTAELSEMIAEGASGWAVSALLASDGHEHRIRVALESDEAGRPRRTARIDDAPVSPGALAERVRVIWITPAMDRLFVGPAGDRRRFLDRQTLAHFADHGALSLAYEKAMRARNALLEQPSPDPAWLDGLERQMAEAGTGVAIRRMQTLVRLQAALNERAQGAFPQADLALDGDFEALAAAGEPASAIEAAYAAALRSARRRDAAAGRALLGVHRADLKVVHRRKAMSADLCSTGEQKALLTSLILANARALLGRDFAPVPLLLLDEAAAHLDSERRAALYDELSALGGQAWLTGTDRDLFAAFGERAQRFFVSDGALEPA
jgi:DNA replication and repair protein RecF